MKRSLHFFVSVWALSTLTVALHAQTVRPNLTLEQSVVMIRAVQQEIDYRNPWKNQGISQGVGSGFVIAAKRIMTNAHNVANFRYIEVKKQNQAQRYPASVEFVAHDCDLALLKIEDPAFFEGTEPLEFGSLPDINSTVQTYGFPVGGRHVSVTEGVVSRIQVDTYSHSRADMHLVVQTDAAINPGNSGGPVMQNGKVVGVAFQGLRSADNIGYMIPTTVIRHFLEDIEDGTYHGFGSFGFAYSTHLHNPVFAAYTGLAQGTEGIVILRTQPNSSVHDLLQEGDIITEINDLPIDNDGLVEVHGLRLHVSESAESLQIGETAPIAFYRDGKLHQETITVALNRPVIPFWREYDQPPRYVVYAGLVFVPLNRNLMETWGRNWVAEMPFNMRYTFLNYDSMDIDPNMKEFVVVSDILPDKVNEYASPYRYEIVREINDSPIYSLDDVYQALHAHSEEYQHIQFFNIDLPLILDTNQADQNHESILEKYSLPNDHAGIKP